MLLPSVFRIVFYNQDLIITKKSLVYHAACSENTPMGSKLDFKNLRLRHQHFYLLIYPEIDADLNQYYCGGGLDLGLNEAAIEAARKLARRFKKNPLKIKKIYASPELRTIQMADLLHDEMKGKIILAREFSDQFLGELEGKPFQRDTKKPLKNDQDLAFSSVVAPAQGETQESFSARIRAGLERMFKEEDLVVLVTHPRVAKEVQEWIGLGAENLKRGALYAIDLPADQGVAHLREI